MKPCVDYHHLLKDCNRGKEESKRRELKSVLQ